MFRSTVRALMVAGLAAVLSVGLLSGCKKDPKTASGTPVKTRVASTTEFRLMQSSTKISSRATGTTIANRCEAATSCSNWPPQPIQ